MPLVSRTFDQLIDFTRTSSATYVDSTGKIVSTPASRNLLTFTQEFDNAAWGKTELTVSANTSTAPDGTTTADIVIPTTNAAAHFVTLSVSMTAGVTYALSVYAKASGYRWLRLSFAAAAFPTSNRAASFDLQTGTVGQVQSGVTATISDAGSGWYRCTIVATATTTATAANGYTVNDADNANATSFSGNGTSGVLLWGAQMEANTAPTTYTRNYGGLYPPRFDYDPVTLAPKGLLIEEQRTNLLTYSEQFDNAAWVKSSATVTADATTSPDGTTDADAVFETVTNATHTVSRSGISIDAGATMTGSVFLKANGRTNFDLRMQGSAGQCIARGSLSGSGSVSVINSGTGVTSGATITQYPGGWYRVTVTGVTTAADTTSSLFVYTRDDTGASTYAGDPAKGLFIYGAQLEAGAFATSYIPTVASQVTRAADQAVIQAPNFAPWYNQSAGTLVVDWTGPTAVTVSALGAVSVTDGTINERVTLRRVNISTDVGAIIVDNNVVQANLTQAGAASGANKAAIAYRTDDVIIAANGTLGPSDTSATMPTVTQLEIGFGQGITYLNGHIRSIRYYPTRLSNAQLQALTA